MSSKPHGGKRKKAYKMPTKIPTGDILIDSSKREWIILSSIAKGGFGEIYTGARSGEPRSQNYVIKIEPSENGPLFCEKTVYIRIGKKENIKEYMNAKGLKSLGMPQFYGSGLHSVDGKKFRFLVMERYGKDLWTIYLENNRLFPASTSFKVAVQILDVLEYIHSKGYVHADIKGANLLLGRQKGYENQVYLVDFGLAAKYTNVYKEDPRRAHNGTVEYISRDGHEGIVTRRGDIEILAYNLLQWISSNLPWEGSKNLNDVQDQKINYMKNYPALISECFKNNTAPKALEEYFKCLVKISPLEEPDYNELRSVMKEGIAMLGEVSSKLDFSLPTGKPRSKTKRCKVSAKIRKGNDGVPARGRQGQLRQRVNRTIEIEESNSEEEEDEEEEDEDEDEDEEDMFIDSTPEKKKKTGRSWKDCPSVVSCAELLFKDDKGLRRSKRNK